MVLDSPKIETNYGGDFNHCVFNSYIVLYFDRWLHLLNEYGVCLLTNMGDTAGSINEVICLSLSLLNDCMCL